MASNYFGELFRMTTWGESHGKAIGVVIDGCPAGVVLSIDDINQALSIRTPGRSKFTSPRKEPDCAELYSGVFEGKTTGAPISIIIFNQDVDSSHYEPIKDLMRPGHANFAYLKKYGVFDHRGGGRASARETALRVAAGAVAKKLLNHTGIKIQAYIAQLGGIEIEKQLSITNTDRENFLKSSTIFCPDPVAESQMIEKIKLAKNNGDSLGGVVEISIENTPVGLGEPIYQKLEAKLASAMMSLPASKGFEIGEGFKSAVMQGSEHNDMFITNQSQPMATNHAGGTLAGISTGMPIVARVAFKPTSSIKKSQKTIDKDGNTVEFKLPDGARHDPCVAIRAVPVVEAMAMLVIADLWLMSRNASVNFIEEA